MASKIRDCLLILKRSLDSNSLNHKLVTEIVDFFKAKTFDDDSDPELLLINEPNYGLIKIISEIPDKNHLSVKYLLQCLLNVLKQLDNIPENMAVNTINVCTKFITTCVNASHKKIVFLVVSETNKKVYIKDHSAISNLKDSFINEFKNQSLSISNVIICKILLEISKKQLLSIDVNCHVLLFCTDLLESEIVKAEKEMMKNCTVSCGIIDMLNDSVLPIFECFDFICLETFNNRKSLQVLPRLYSCFKKCVVPPKKVVLMSVYLPFLKMFNDKMSVFTGYIINDCSWFNNLFYYEFLNPTFKRERIQTICNFYHLISSFLINLDENDSEMVSAVNYFKSFFVSEFEKPVLFPFEMLHVQGLSYFSSLFKKVLLSSEFDSILFKSSQYLLPIMSYYVESDCFDSLDLLLSSSALIVEMKNISERSVFLLILYDLCVKSFQVYPVFPEKENLRISLSKTLLAIDKSCDSLRHVIDKLYETYLIKSVDQSCNGTDLNALLCFLLTLNNDITCEKWGYSKIDCSLLSQKIFDYLVVSILTTLKNFNLCVDFVRLDCSTIATPSINNFVCHSTEDLNQLIVLTNMAKLIFPLTPPYLELFYDDIFGLILNLLQSNPLILPLYDFLSCLLNLNFLEGNFLDRFDASPVEANVQNTNLMQSSISVILCLTHLNNYLDKLLSQIIYFDGELFKSAFNVLLSVPSHPMIVSKIINNHLLFQNVLTMSISNVPLVKSIVITLIRWSNMNINMSDFIREMLPFLKPFIVCNKIFSVEEKPFFEKATVSEHILFLISKTCPQGLDELLSLRDFSYEFYKKPISKCYFPLPISENSFEMNISELIPTTIHLLMTSIDIKIRRNSCELYHFLVTYVLGLCINEENYASNSIDVWRELCKPILILSVDPDVVIRSILNPLLPQIARQIAMCDHSLPLVSYFVDLLIDGLSHPILNSVRCYSSYCLSEFFRYSFNLPDNHWETSSYSIQKMLSLLRSGTLFLPSRKLIGEVMLYRTILDSISNDCYFVKEYIMDILKQLMHTSQTLNHSNFELCYVIKVTQILISENDILMYELKPSHSDILHWFLKYCASSSQDSCSFARQLLTTFFPILGLENIKHFIGEILTSKFYSFFNENEDSNLNYLFIDDKIPNVLSDLMSINKIISFFHWLKFECDLNFCSYIENNHFIIESVLNFLKIASNKTFINQIKPPCTISGNFNQLNDTYTLLKIQHLSVVVIRSIVDLLECLDFSCDFVKKVVNSSQFCLFAELLIFSPFIFYSFSLNFDFQESHFDLVSKLVKLSVKHPIVSNRLVDTFEMKSTDHFYNISKIVKHFKNNKYVVSISDLESIFIIKTLGSLNVDWKTDYPGVPSFTSSIHNLMKEVINMDPPVHKREHLKYSSAFSNIYSIKLTNEYDDIFIGNCIELINSCSSEKCNVSKHFMHCLINLPNIFTSLTEYCCSKSYIWFMECILDFCISESKLHIFEEVGLKSFLKNFNYFINWGNICSENNLRLFSFIYYLVSKTEYIIFDNSNFLKWVANFISYIDHPCHILSLKTLCLFESDSALLASCLKIISAKYFSSKAISKAYKYASWQSLLHVLEKTSSILIIEMFFRFVEFNSIVLSDFKTCLSSSIENNWSLICLIFDTFSDISLPPSRRLNVAKHFFYIALKNSPNAVILDFFIKNGIFLSQTIKKQDEIINKSAQELVTLIVCYHLFMILYEKINLEQLSSLELLKSFGMVDVKSLNTFIISCCLHFQSVDCYLFSSDKQSLVRELQCTVYNTLSLVLMKTQKKENIITFFLFLEDSKKDKFIWRRILNTTLITDFKSYKRDTSNLSQTTVNKLEASEPLSSSPITSSSDITSQNVDSHCYDLTGVLVNIYETQPVDCSECHFDVINNHPMMFSVCKLVTFMDEHFCRPLIGNGIKVVPEFMKKLLLSLLQPNPVIVKTFILKIIHSNQNVFRPFAVHFLDHIMASIVNKSCGSMMNHFLSDIVLMLLDWCSDLPPNCKMPSKEIANKMLLFLISLTKPQEIELFNDFINLLKSVIGKWKNLFEIPFNKIISLLSNSNTDEVTKGIEITIIFISFSAKTFSQTEKNNLSSVAISLLKGCKGKQFIQVSEMNSLFLKKVIFNGGSCSVNHRDSPYVRELEEAFNYLYSKNKLSYLKCLLKFRELHKNILKKHFEHILKIGFESKVAHLHGLALSLIRESIDFVDHFLLSVKFKEFNIFSNVSNVSSNIALNQLKIFLEFSRKIPVQLVESFLSQIAAFSKEKDHSVGIRSVVYDIFISLDRRKNLFEILSGNMDKVVKEIKLNLFKGLSDKSGFIRDKVMRYLIESSLPENLEKMLSELMSHLRLPDNELLYVTMLTSIVLEKYNKACGNCNLFQSIPQENHFEENSLAFESQVNYSANVSNPPEEMLTQNTVINVKSGEDITQASEIESFNLDKQSDEEKIEVLRSYYNSELPYLGVKYSDFFVPLYNVVFLNSNMSIVVFESLLAMLLSNKKYLESNEPLKTVLTSLFSMLFKSTVNFSIPLFSSLTNLICQYAIPISNFKEEFFYVCRKCHLENKAIIVFEKELQEFNGIKTSYKNVLFNESHRNDFVKLAFFYYYLGEYEASIYISSAFCDMTLTEAFKAMSVNRWDKALTNFKELAKTNENIPILKSLYTESTYYCLLHMSDWLNLYKELQITKFVPSFKNYFECHKMLLLFKCDVFVNFYISDKADTYFHDVILKLSHINHLTLMSCVEICLLCLKRSDIFLKKFIHKILNYLVSLGNLHNFHSLTRKGELDSLFKIMSEFLLFNTVKNTESDQTFLKYLLNSTVKDCSNCSELFLWERIINTRVLLMDAVLLFKSSDNLKKIAVIKWFSALFKNFISHKNFHACRTYLLKLHELEGNSIQFKVEQIEIQLLKCDLESDLDKKLHSLISAFKIIHGLKSESNLKIHSSYLKCSDILNKCMVENKIIKPNANLTKLFRLHSNILCLNEKSIKEIYLVFLINHIKFIYLNIEEIKDIDGIINSILFLIKLPKTSYIPVTEEVKLEIDKALIQSIFSLLRKNNIGFIFLPIVLQLDQNKHILQSHLKTIDQEICLFWLDEIICKVNGPMFSIYYPTVLKLATLYTSKFKSKYFLYHSKLKDIPHFNELNTIIKYSELEHKFFKSIKSLCHPTVLFIHYIKEIIAVLLENNNCKKVQKLFNKILDECFYSECVYKGVFFKINEPYKQHIIDVKNNYCFSTNKSTCDKLNLIRNELITIKIKSNLKLEDLCPYLSNRMLNLDLEFQSCLKSNNKFYKVFKILPNIKIMSKLNYMISLNVLDTEGQTHKWLISYDQDTRCLLNFSKNIFIANHILKLHNVDNCVFSYCVTPLNSNLCIIEIPQNMVELSCLIDLSLSTYNSGLRISSVYDHYSWIMEHFETPKSLIDMHQELLFKTSHSSIVSKYKQNVNKFPPFILSDFLLSFTSFFDYRKCFLKSYLFMSIFHWLFSSSINLHNTLVCLDSGSTICLPLNFITKMSTEDILENCIPVRLTPQIVSLFPLNDINFLKNMFKILENLDKKLFGATMHCMNSGKGNKLYSLCWNNAIKSAQLKLDGQNPIKLIEPILSKYNISILNDYLNLKSDKLSLEAQIECIVHLSRDENILAQCWAGLEPWL